MTASSRTAPKRYRKIRLSAVQRRTFANDYIWMAPSPLAVSVRRRAEEPTVAWLPSLRGDRQRTG